MALENKSEALPPLAPTLAPLAGVEGSARAAIDRISRSGFRFIQLSATLAGMRPRELDRSARRDLLSHLRRVELEVAGVDCWIPIADFTDPVRVDRAAAAVRDAIALAADLGRVPISLILPELPEVITDMVDCAHHHGVMLADHAVPSVKRSGVGLGIDPVAWLSQNADPVAAVFQAGSELLCARLSDLTATGMRIPIGTRGEGRLDLLGYRTALSVSGSRRPAIVDARQWSDPWQGAAQTLAAWV